MNGSSRLGLKWRWRNTARKRNASILVPKNRYRFLYVGGPPVDQEAIQEAMKQAGANNVCERAEDLSAFKDALARGTWDAALIDTQSPDISLPAALSVLSKTAKNVPAIVVSEQSDKDTTGRILKAGATYSVPRSDLQPLIPILRMETYIVRSTSD